MSQEIGQGKSFPLGATINPRGVSFSIYSKHATEVELLLFDDADAAKPSLAIALDPRKNRTYQYWHVYVPGLKAGQIYAYRVNGPFEPEKGHRFAPDKILLDPYGRIVAVPKGYNRRAASKPGDNSAVSLKNAVADLRSYNWEGDRPLHRPFSKTVIYEMHVGGFTRNANSGVAPEKRGTYAGLIEKIPYLQDLGVTAVELLPIFEFDEQDSPEGRVNYWGYAPVSFFAPHHSYSSRKDPLGPMDEFRDMVKALHGAGIEVILDVVFNHTSEGEEVKGPTFCFRGLENSVYYILEDDKARYADYSGTGNTLNANHSIVRRLILDSLHYWVEIMHVDGFRFDLASILSRDEHGKPLENPPILYDIASDPVLAGTKLIAEAWDAGGLYQVGVFAGDNWQEWNGKFRDDVRSFMKGDNDSVWRFSRRLFGSPDIYGHEEREPEQSINFITCHDGFTLNDLVSYDRKHNEANGEENRDGSDGNLSWNCGIDGPTADPHIEELRGRQVKNFLAVTLLAMGTPMLLMGDEVRRTQFGNNNAYCQDNEISWFDWTLLDKHPDIYRFVKQLIKNRFRFEVVSKRGNLSLNEILRKSPIRYHGIRLNQPDWNYESHTLAFTANILNGEVLFHAMVNAYTEPLEFELPPIGNEQDSWRLWLDTYRPSPDDIYEWADAPLFQDSKCVVQPRSIVALFAQIL